MPIPGFKSAPAAWTLVLAALLAFAFQGSRGLWGPDEGRYTNVALQMVESGDWLVPRRHDEHPHLTKPPLTYWAIGASTAVFGASEWSMRLPGALAALLTAFALLRLGRDLVPQRPWLPVLIHATTFLPFVATNIASTDNLLAAFETGAMAAFVRVWCLPEGGLRQRWRIAMWAAFGLAFLTKGPPGLLPLLAMQVFLWRERRRDPQGAAANLRLYLPWGLLLFALIAVPWFVLLAARVTGLWPYLIGNEVVGRVFTDVHHRNGQWYGALVVYLPVVLVGTLPWSVVCWRRLPRAWRVLRGGGVRTWWSGLIAQERLLWTWLVLPLLIFCLARSRLSLYLLPLFAPFALLVARTLQGVALKAPRPMQIAVWCVLLLLLKGLAGAVHYRKDTRAIAEKVRANWEHTPSEIVFVEETALYGLRHYLGVQIERVSLGDNPGGSFDESLQDELLDEEGYRLWITTADRLAELRVRARAAGLRWRPLGQHDRYLMGTLEPLVNVSAGGAVAR